MDLSKLVCEDDVCMEPAQDDVQVPILVLAMLTLRVVLLHMAQKFFV